MQKLSIFLKSSMVEVALDDAAGVSLKFLSGTLAATARVRGTAAFNPEAAGDHAFKPGQWHKVPKSKTEFVWRTAENGFVEVDFRESGRTKRIFYRKGKRPRIKTL